MKIDNENLDFMQDTQNEQEQPSAGTQEPNLTQSQSYSPEAQSYSTEPNDDFGGDELDFSLFTGGDAGYQVLSNEKLQALAKKLPSWSLEPPAKYIK